MQRSKLLLILVLFLIIIGGFFLFNKFFETTSNTSTPIFKESASQPETNAPRIVSTKPDPLEGAVIRANDVIEITFSQPLENDPEFRRRFDPEIEYKLELSSDKKVVKLIPLKPYELGTTYTLFILPDTKFVGGGRLDGEKTFHFSTIKYRGV